VSGPLVSCIALHGVMIVRSSTINMLHLIVCCLLSIVMIVIIIIVIVCCCGYGYGNFSVLSMSAFPISIALLTHYESLNMCLVSPIFSVVPYYIAIEVKDE